MFSNSKSLVKCEFSLSFFQVVFACSDHQHHVHYWCKSWKLGALFFFSEEQKKVSCFLYFLKCWQQNWICPTNTNQVNDVSKRKDGVTGGILQRKTHIFFHISIKILSFLVVFIRQSTFLFLRKFNKNHIKLRFIHLLALDPEELKCQNFFFDLHGNSFQRHFGSK